MQEWFCWILLICVLVYFYRIDRTLQRTLRELAWFRAQLRPWGFFSPEDQTSKKKSG